MTGRVPPQRLLDELGEVEVAEQEIRTVLSGQFRDQAALYGFLHRLRAFGLEVVEVRRIGTRPEPRTTEPGPGGPGAAAVRGGADELRGA